MRAGARDCIKLLLAAAASVAETNGTGNTPLHQAVLHRAGVSVLRLLLDSGADIHARGARGQTALHCAVKMRDHAAATYLPSATQRSMHRTRAA